MNSIGPVTTARMRNGENPRDKYGDYANIFILITPMDGTPFVAVYGNNWWCNDAQAEAWTVHPIHPIGHMHVMPDCTIYPADIKYWQFANHAIDAANPGGVHIVDRQGILVEEVT